jgi:hypothetical protein
MEKNEIQLEEQDISKKENIINDNIKIKKKNKNNLKDELLNKKTHKRIRDYSPTMDIEEDQSNNRKKRMKVPLRKMVERIHLDDKDERNKSTKNSKENNNLKINKKKRGIKIFSDMSVSEISNNLFKNYYPCLLPSYYPEQIKQQIIDDQLEKLISNFNQSKNEIIINNKIKIQQNMDYLRQLAEKQGEWVPSYPEDDYDDRVDKDDEDYDESDSNNENNSNNTYPEDESVENEDEEDNFGDEYGDYDNNEDYNNDYD